MYVYTIYIHILDGTTMENKRKLIINKISENKNNCNTTYRKIFEIYLRR